MQFIFVKAKPSINSFVLTIGIVSTDSEGSVLWQSVEGIGIHKNSVNETGFRQYKRFVFPLNFLLLMMSAANPLEVQNSGCTATI